MKLVVAQRLTLAHGIRGGMEMQAQHLSQGLQARGHELLVLTTPHPAGLREGHEDGVPVRYVRPGSYRRYERRWWAACYAELVQLRRAGRLDLLLSQSAGALGYLPRAAAELGLPSAVIVHGTLTGALRTQLRAARSPRGLYRLLRLLATLPPHLLLWRRAARSVDCWIAVSAEVAGEWRRELQLPAERVVTVPNGVDTARFRPDPQARSSTRARLGLEPGAPLLLAAGRLEQEKGFQLAIALLRQLLPRFPAARLIIAGTGVYRQSLERAAADLGAAVMLTGHVPNQELPALMAAADLFVMPTLRDEGLPMTLLEALAAGLPVLATRVGGIPSAIDHGQTGLLLPMGQLDDWVAACAALLWDQRRRAAMSALARQVAEARFSRTQMVAATESILLELIAAPRGGMPGAP